MVVCLEREREIQGGKADRDRQLSEGKGEREGMLTVAVPLLRAYSL